MLRDDLMTIEIVDTGEANVLIRFKILIVFNHRGKINISAVSNVKLSQYYSTPRICNSNDDVYLGTVITRLH